VREPPTIRGPKGGCAGVGNAGRWNADVADVAVGSNEAVVAVAAVAEGACSVEGTLLTRLPSWVIPVAAGPSVANRCWCRHVAARSGVLDVRQDSSDDFELGVESDDAGGIDVLVAAV